MFTSPFLCFLRNPTELFERDRGEMYPFSVSHTESLLFDNTRSNSLKNRPLAYICGTDCFLVKSQYVTFHVLHKTVGTRLFVMKVSYERLRGLRHVRCLC